MNQVASYLRDGREHWETTYGSADDDRRDRGRTRLSHPIATGTKITSHAECVIPRERPGRAPCESP